jgi:hypothetical protein
LSIAAAILQTTLQKQLSISLEGMDGREEVTHTPFISVNLYNFILPEALYVCPNANLQDNQHSGSNLEGYDCPERF